LLRSLQLRDVALVPWPEIGFRLTLAGSVVLAQEPTVLARGRAVEVGPRIRVIIIGCVAIVKDLAHAHRDVTGRRENTGDRDAVGASHLTRVIIQVVDVRRVRAATIEDARAAGRAHSLLHVRVCQKDRVIHEFVKVWRHHVLVLERLWLWPAVDHRPQVVVGDEEHVRPRRDRHHRYMYCTLKCVRVKHHSDPPPFYYGTGTVPGKQTPLCLSIRIDEHQK
jgi:hypothetical protein